MTQHPTQTVGRQYPKAWIIGKTLEQIEGNDLKELVKAAKKRGYTVLGFAKAGFH